MVLKHRGTEDTEKALQYNSVFSVPLCFHSRADTCRYVTASTRRKLNWNSDKMKFTNCEAADQFSRREYRDGWEV